MLIKRGIDPRTAIWSVSTLPKFNIKDGPLDFLLKMWKSEKRNLLATLACYPLDLKSKGYLCIGTFLIDL